MHLDVVVGRKKQAARIQEGSNETLKLSNISHRSSSPTSTMAKSQLKAELKTLKTQISKLKKDIDKQQDIVEDKRNSKGTIRDAKDKAFDLKVELADAENRRAEIEDELEGANGQ